MKEREINEKRHWKAEVFPYDVFIPDDSQECSYCLTYNQATLLRGLLEPVGWLTRWWSDTTDVSQDEIEAFRDDLIRRLMMACCDGNLIYTYDEDGNLEVSDDGGTVFVPAPQDDIRINPRVVFPVPPVTEGADELCLAADGMVNLIKEGITDQLTDDMSRYTLGQLIHDWTTTIIGTSNPFTALVTIVANQIFALLISAVRAALTDGVFARLKCIFSARISVDLSFDDTSWGLVRSDILSQITGIAGVFLEHLVYLLGSGGLTNLARSMAGSSDAGCCPECSVDIWSVLNYDGHDIGTLLSTGFDYLIVQGTSHPDFSTPYNVMLTTTGDNDCCGITSIEILTGSDVEYFGRDCGTARWPGGPTGSVPVPTVSDKNTLFLRGDSVPFTAKVTFA